MELTNISVIKDLFERHGFSFTKSLGQNFLINPAVCPKIAELGGAKPGVCALEIGTGVGVLTKELAERCDKVIAVEIDTSLKPILEETLADYDNVEIVFADVMETDLAALLAEKAGGMETVVCANLPYHLPGDNAGAGKPPAYLRNDGHGSERSRRQDLRKARHTGLRRDILRGVLLQRAEAAVQGRQGQLYALPECGQRGHTAGREARRRHSRRRGTTAVPYNPGVILPAEKASGEPALRGASHF